MEIMNSQTMDDWCEFICVSGCNDLHKNYRANGVGDRKMFYYCYHNFFGYFDLILAHSEHYWCIIIDRDKSTGHYANNKQSMFVWYCYCFFCLVYFPAVYSLLCIYLLDISPVFGKHIGNFPRRWPFEDISCNVMQRQSIGMYIPSFGQNLLCVTYTRYMQMSTTNGIFEWMHITYGMFLEHGGWSAKTMKM